MPAGSASFEIIFKTIADATGITKIGESLEGLKGRLESFKETAEKGLALVGLGLGINELIELGKEAAAARDQLVGFYEAVLRSKDGSPQLAAELDELNERLDRTTGVSQKVTQAIEQQFATTKASGEQIKGLTQGVIEYAAATKQSGETIESRAEALANVIAVRLRGATDEGTVSLKKFGITATDLNGIIAQLAARGGKTAEELYNASGGLKGYQSAVEDLRLSVGRLVLLVGIPFLTTLNQETADAQQKVNDASQAYTAWGAKIVEFSAVTASTLANFVSQARSAFDFAIAKGQVLVLSISSSVAAALKKTNDAVRLAVADTIIGLDDMVQAVAATTAKLSGGKIKIDTSGLHDQLGDLALSADDFLGKFSSDLKASGKAIDDTLTDAKGKVQAASDAFTKAYNAPKEAGERAVAEYKRYASLLDQLAKGAKAGSSLIDPPGDPNAARKAATDALTNSKYALAAAQQTYATEIERTNALEDAGAISVDQADAQRRAAIEAYIQQLKQVAADLPRVIALQEKAGSTQGLAAAKLELGEIDKLIVKANADLGNTTFFGKIRSQIVQLKNEWSDLGKQVGGFLTSQFQQFASGAGSLISGLIFRTTSWKDAILGLGEQFVASLATMLIQWVLARTVMSALNKAFGSADASAASAQASSAAAAWSPAAIAASIASYGAAAGLGLTAYLAAIGIGTAGATAASGVGGAPGFAKGDLTPGVATPAIVGEEGPEFIFSNPAVQHFGPDFLRNLHQIGVSRASTAPAAAAVASSGTSSSAPRASRDRGRTLVFFDFDKLMREHQRNGGIDEIVHVLNRRGGHFKT